MRTKLWFVIPLLAWVGSAHAATPAMAAPGSDVEDLLGADSSLLFSPALDRASRDDRIATTCEVLAGVARARGCNGSRATFADPSALIRVFDPWGGGFVDAPCSVVVAMACMDDTTAAQQACEQELSALVLDPAQGGIASTNGEPIGEAREPLTPLGILCALLVGMGAAYGCQKSWPGSPYCPPAGVAWMVLCGLL